MVISSLVHSAVFHIIVFVVFIQSFTTYLLWKLQIHIFSLFIYLIGYMNILPAGLDKCQICSRPISSTSSPLLAMTKLTSLETSFKMATSTSWAGVHSAVWKKNSDNPSFSVKTPYWGFQVTTFTNSTDWDSHIKHFCFIFPLSYCWWKLCL